MKNKKKHAKFATAPLALKGGLIVKVMKDYRGLLLIATVFEKQKMVLKFFTTFVTAYQVIRIV